MLVPIHIQHHNMLSTGDVLQGYVAIKDACAVTCAPVACAHHIFLISTGNYAISELLDLLAQLPKN